MGQQPMTEAQVADMMRQMGIERYTRNVRKARERGAETATKPGQALMTKAVEEFTTCLHQWCRKARSQPGPKHASVPFIETLPHDVTAFITAQVVLDGVSGTMSFLTIAQAIASAMEDERKFSMACKCMPEEWRKMVRRVKTVNEHHKRRVLTGAVRRMELSFDSWSRTQKYELGALLLELFAASTGLVEIITIPNGHRNGRMRRSSVVRATPETLEWMRTSHEAHEARFPFYLPTVTPPEDWTGPNAGGYPANVFLRWPLIQRQWRKAPALGPDRMPKVYEAVNTLQGVSWRINQDVWQTFDHFWRAGLPCADVPGRELLQLPAKPADFLVNPDAKLAWKKEAAGIHRHNAKLGSRLAATAKIHFVGRQFGQQDFYFPWKLDFRGRAYPIPGFLTPQGCPLAKGLLEFAQGKPLSMSDGSHEWWLIHGANCWGTDKVPMAERIAWVRENEGMILAIGEDPIENHQWFDASKPWQFLAWCFEFWRFRQEGIDRFQSHIPVAMDGSNNGLQLYSLLLRDPVGAAATNVSPSERPRDIYADVAAMVTEMLRKDVGNPRKVGKNITADQASRAWLEFVGDTGLPRGAAKRPVMVTPYGGTQYAIREYVEDWYEEQIEARRLNNHRPFASTFIHTKYLTGLMVTAIEQVVIGARAGMSWLRQVARMTAEANVPIRWTTPSGFVAYQCVTTTAQRVIRTKIGRICRKRNARMDTDHVSLSGQQNGFPPNFVHSLDASIMTLTILACAKQAVQAFSMVHDSFATHAADAPVMARTLRAIVADIFSRNLLEELAEELQKQLPAGVTLPPVPALGELDVRQVIESIYFFA